MAGGEELIFRFTIYVAANNQGYYCTVYESEPGSLISGMFWKAVPFLEFLNFDLKKSKIVKNQIKINFSIFFSFNFEQINVKFFSMSPTFS